MLISSSTRNRSELSKPIKRRKKKKCRNFLSSFIIKNRVSCSDGKGFNWSRINRYFYPLHDASASPSKSKVCAFRSCCQIHTSYFVTLGSSVWRPIRANDTDNKAKLLHGKSCELREAKIAGGIRVPSILPRWKILEKFLPVHVWENISYLK